MHLNSLCAVFGSLRRYFEGYLHSVFGMYKIKMKGGKNKSLKIN